MLGTLPWRAEALALASPGSGSRVGERSRLPSGAVALEGGVLPWALAEAPLAWRAEALAEAPLPCRAEALAEAPLPWRAEVLPWPLAEAEALAEAPLPWRAEAPLAEALLARLPLAAPPYPPLLRRAPPCSLQPLPWRAEAMPWALAEALFHPWMLAPALGTTRSSVCSSDPSVCPPTF